MGDYSLEPPRKHCVVNHTFTQTDESEPQVSDASPQETGSNLVGDVTFGHTGIIGTGAKLVDTIADVTVNADTQFYSTPSTTLTAWARSDTPVPSGTTNVTATITIDGTSHSLTHTNTTETDEWQFVALDFDGDVINLYYGTESSAPAVVAEVSDTGSVDDASLSIAVERDGYVDDVRQYRRTIASDNIHNLYTIGVENGAVELLRDEWDNNGFPYFGTNKQLASTLAESSTKTWRQLDYIREARHIDDAAGAQLDAIGRLADISRKEDESDGKYRARIKGIIKAGRSSGTFQDILEAAATVVDTSTERVQVDENYSSDPATAFVKIRNEDLQDSVLTGAEITSILKDVVLAGHDIEVQKQPAQPFIVINDSMATDPSNGLTSDSTSDGGQLTEDI